MKLLSGMIALLLLSSCTRPENESSSVKINIPSMRKLQQGISALSDDPPVHVVINVNRNDGRKTYCSYDANWGRGEGPCQFVNFPEVTVNTPTGSGQLVQVLSVYEGSGNLAFYYGDGMADVSLGESSVSIPISFLGTSSGTGKMVGRFLDATNSGPTGIMTLEVETTSGKPPMLIDRSEIFSGWFRTLIISGVNVRYRVNGIERFGGPKKLEDFKAMADATGGNSSLGGINLSRVSYVSPSSGSSEYKFAGFFGPGLAGDLDLRTCNPSQVSTFCTGSPYNIEYSYHLKPTSEIRGPYGSFGGSSLSLLTGPPATATWWMLPGTESLFDGFDIFYTQNKTDFTNNHYMSVSRGDDKIDCNALKTVPGINILGQHNSITAGSNTFTAPASYTPVSDAIFLCPHKGGKYSQSVLTNADKPNMGGGGGPYMRVEGLHTYNSSNPIPKDFCFSIEFKTFEPCSGGACTPHNIIDILDLTITLAGDSQIGFYSDSGCSTSRSTSIIYDSTSSSISSGPVYFKIPAGSSLTSFPFDRISIPSTAEVSYNQGSYENVPVAP